jgi:hypothetical protein
MSLSNSWKGGGGKVLEANAYNTSRIEIEVQAIQQYTSYECYTQAVKPIGSTQLNEAHI